MSCLRSRRCSSCRAGREARPGAVSIATTLVAAIVGSWLLEVVEVRWWVRWILLGVIAAPLMSIANAAFRADVRRAQRRRESQAAAIKQDVVDGKPVGPHTLYLRPFISTDRLMTQALPTAVGAADQVPVHLDLETVLTRSLRDTAPLIGLGRAEEVDEGVARIVTSDDGWQDVVLALARGAELVVMLPLSRPSTTWELGQIVEKGLLHKTLFVMPEVPYQRRKASGSTPRPPTGSSTPEYESSAPRRTCSISRGNGSTPSTPRKP
jgi:hypothetical protein